MYIRFLIPVITASVFSILAGTIVYAQADDGTVVGRVGSTEITAREFRQRFELTPWPGKNKEGWLDVVKEQFLYAVLAEKALALEAEAAGYGNDPGVQTIMERLSRLYAKDFMYDQEVRRSIDFSDEELRKEYIRSRTTAYVSFLYFESTVEADIAWERIREGTPFDRIVTDNPEHMVRAHQVERNTTVTELLDAIDSLQPGQISPPVATQYGYYIVRLDNAFTDPVITENSFRQERINLERQLRRRMEQPRTKAFVDGLVGDRQLEVFGAGLRRFGVEFERVLERKRAFDSADHPLVRFDDLDFDELMLALREDLNAPLLRVSGETWDIGEALQRLRMFGVWFQRDPAIPLPSQVRNLLEDLAVDEIISSEALSRNYQERPEVRSELATWRDNYKAELYKRDLLRDIEVPYEEIRRYFDENNERYRRPMLVNIREILVSTQAEAHNILTQLDSGRDFGELARLHSRRRWAAHNDGEFGFFPSTLHGDIGRIAATLEPGERYGPIPAGDGFSVIELIEKRLPESDLNQTFEEVEESLREMLLREKQSFVLDSHINRLLDKYTFSIDYQALERIDVTQIQFFAVRRFGFGGSNPAVPILDRQIGWIFERAYEKFIIP